MNIVIPLGGKGERFKNEDYTLPKVLTPVFGKKIISWVLESFKLNKTDCFTIIYNNHLDEYNFEDILRKEYDFNFNFIKLPFQTSGPVETILYGLSKLNDSILNEPLIIHDGDSFIKNNTVQNINGVSNTIFYTIDTNPNPIFSYIQLDEHNYVIDIKEKSKISNFANIGCYTFKNSHIFKKYASQCDQSLNEIYISHVYKKILDEKLENVNSYEVSKNEYVCLGTPLQVIEFCRNNTSNTTLKFCFDLDNTLVTYPKINGDYTTVEPIQRNIDFLNHLKSQGHYVIIHTARRMKTHSGNISKVIKDIGKITFDTLDKFNIQYDELCFGKPHADFYIDDLAVNSFSNLEKSTGFYINTITPRSFNTIKCTESSIIKTSEKDLSGEIYYYKNIPKEILYLYPKLINSDNSYLEIEKINGTVMSIMYSHKEFTLKHLNMLFESLNNIHSVNIVDENNINIYENYSSKLMNRYENYNYSRFKNSKLIYDKILKNLNEYEMYQKGFKSVIHGDFVFSNILLVDKSIKLIDMRGKVGNKLTIFGDKFYDYAKLYQSLIGYDFILNNKSISFSYIDTYIKSFESNFVSMYGEEQLKYLKCLTASLLFTLIPLHNDHKCEDYYNLINYLI
jgi:capsule biosynthesis phosphatase